jgi:hypothetical protein
MASSTSIINTVQIPDDDNFKRSYDQFQDYPESLVYQTSYPWALKESKSRLNEQCTRLFRLDGFKIPFRDFVDDGKFPPISPHSSSINQVVLGSNIKLKKQNCFDELGLKSWLGDQTSSTPAGRSITKKDPKCRFMYAIRNPIPMGSTLISHCS